MLAYPSTGTRHKPLHAPELNNTVDAIIGQVQPVHLCLYQYGDDINNIVNAGNNFECVQGDMRRVLQGHEGRLQHVESLHQQLKQH